MSRVLDGIRVLDLSRYIAGPYCGMILADMGAEVIKVEKMNGGDDTRQLGPWKDGKSLYFPAYNRNKKSITLNFRSDTGKELLRQLIAKADVVLENFKPGTMEKMGLSYEVMKEINPKIILVSVTGFGQVGPYSPRPAFDIVVSAMGGLYNMDAASNMPVPPKGAIGDTMGAMYAAIGTLAAIVHRQRTGEGQWVDVSMFHSLVEMQGVNLAKYATADQTEREHTVSSVDCAPAGTFKAKDGFVNIHGGTDAMFSRLKTVIQDPVLCDAKYEDVGQRVKDKELLKDIVAGWAIERTCSEIDEALVKAGVTVGVINTVDKIYNDVHLNATKQFVEIDVPGVGSVPYPAPPFRLLGTPMDSFEAAPELGQNNEEIYTGLLGLTAAQYQDLKNNGLI